MVLAEFEGHDLLNAGIVQKTRADSGFSALSDHRSRDPSGLGRLKRLMI
jgi:hypothetical protein